MPDGEEIPRNERHPVSGWGESKLPEEEDMTVYDMKFCDYCQSPIDADQRWVREKIYDPDERDPGYHHYHAEPFLGQEGSCWERKQTEREIARAAIAASRLASAGAH
jgi:hypothetical protein